MIQQFLNPKGMHSYGEVVVVTKKMVFFTEHQIRIAQLIANDYRPVEVARELKVSRRDIQTLLDRMRKKIAVHSVPALLAYLYRKNVIQ